MNLANTSQGSVEEMEFNAAQEFFRRSSHALASRNLQAATELFNKARQLFLLDSKRANPSDPRTLLH